jgi:hypothetical protein
MTNRIAFGHPTHAPQQKKSRDASYHAPPAVSWEIVSPSALVVRLLSRSS